jgi:hypothetical protein
MPGVRNRNNRRKNKRQKFRNAFPGNEIPKCPYCGQNVRDVLTAIALNEGATPAHFDCVLRQLAEEEELQPKEKIIYLGNGSFGIVRFKSQSDPKNFVIRKRIQIEPEKIDLDWRKSVASKIIRK